METDSPNIRQIVRLNQVRRARVASITATMAFEDELKLLLAEQRAPRAGWFKAEDVRLFANSFLTVFIAAMIFLS
jgi:hypothetical protein